MSWLELCNHQKALAEEDSAVTDHHRRRHYQCRPNYTESKDHNHHMMDNIMARRESQKCHGVYFSLYSPEAMHSIVSKMVLNENHSMTLYYLFQWKWIFKCIKSPKKFVLDHPIWMCITIKSPDKNPVMPKNLPFRFTSSVEKITPTK